MPAASFGIAEGAEQQHVMTAEHTHTGYCERCGAELLPADPAPLCAACWASDSNFSAPSLMIRTHMDWNGGTPNRPASGREHHFGLGLEYVDPNGKVARARRRRSRRMTLAVAAVLSVGMLFAIVPAAISSTTPGPVHLGQQQVDKGTEACLQNLYTLAADKKAGRPSPANITCPVSGQPYSYTQYQGVTTIECPNAAKHEHTHIYIRTDQMVPIVN
jgi:hypothetical protein